MIIAENQNKGFDLNLQDEKAAGARQARKDPRNKAAKNASLPAAALQQAGPSTSSCAPSTAAADQLVVKYAAPEGGPQHVAQPLPDPLAGAGAEELPQSGGDVADSWQLCPLTKVR